MYVRVRNNILITVWSGKVDILTIFGTNVLDPPRLMGFVQVQNMVVNVHIFRAGSNDVGNKILNSIQHIGIGISTISFIIMRKNLKLMNVAE